MLSRRTLFRYALAAALPGQGLLALPVQAGKRNTLVIAQTPEPSVLTTALTTAPPTQIISPKLFDGLLYLNPQNGPQPQLAEHWESSADGLRYTFNLRPGVRWHDGQPFTSEDVAFSVNEVWKVYSSRGRSAFPNVEAVETPDPHTCVWHLSKPTPYLLSALNARDSQVLPKHLYAGRDILGNPANTHPIGTGPFRFKAWSRGRHLVLERNPDYWQSGQPALDHVIFRFINEPSSISAALETGAVDVALGSSLTFNDLQRLGHSDGLQVEPRLASYGGTGIMALEFNLDRTPFQDIRVRHGFAHAIDKAFILTHILQGQGSLADSPIPRNFPQFHSSAGPDYPFDPARAEQLLDQAGLPRQADGIRLRLSLDPSPSPVYIQTAHFLRSSLARVGIRLEIRLQDFAQFLERIYRHYDFDLNLSPASTAPDPAIGLQRFYWSKNRQPGVAYSNATHYASDEADRLLEAAQVEIDPQRRWQLYERFQALVMHDLPRIPLVSTEESLVSRRGIRNLVESVDGGFIGNLAQVRTPEAF